MFGRRLSNITAPAEDGDGAEPVQMRNALRNAVWAPTDIDYNQRSWHMTMADVNLNWVP